MNYPKIFERVYGQPLALTRSRFMSIHAVLFPRIKGHAPLIEAGDLAAVESRQKMRAMLPAKKGAGPAKTFMGKRVNWLAPSVTRDEYGNITSISDPRLYRFAAPGIAHLPIAGVICKNPSSFEENCGGAMDITPIGEALKQALHDDDVTTILLDIDSPGGEITNVQETAEAIRAANGQKKVVAFTDAGCCSAAYWLASAAGEFFSTKTADIGSIGVYCALLDQTLALEMEGLKLEFFSRGARKGIGLPGRELTDDDRAYLQAGVDECYANFCGAVKEFRPQVSADNFEAQVYSGTNALAQKLVDGIVPDYDALVAALSAMYGRAG